MRRKVKAKGRVKARMRLKPSCVMRSLSPRGVGSGILASSGTIGRRLGRRRGAWHVGKRGISDRSAL